MAELAVSFGNDDADPGEILNLCKGVIAKAVGHMSTSTEIIHRHQCDFLVRVLSETQVTLTHIHHDHSPRLRIPLLHHLHQTLVDAERLLATDWLKAQAGDVKEALSKLIYDVKWHMDVLNGVLVELELELSSCTGRLSPGDERWLLEAKRKDDKVLQERCSHQLSSKYLNPEELLNHRSMGISLGKGASAEVREITLFGSKHAMKIFHSSRSFKQEVAALLALGHHPNVVHLLWYSETASQCYLIMEKMDMDLTTFLAHFQKMVKTALSGVKGVDLMLEVAQGVRFIHSKGMAHRDLKPGNVLVNVVEDDKMRIRSVKIADFGLTKTKDVSRTYGGQTMNVGTTRYMAPEVIKGADDPEKGEFNSQKADVYSFAVMCSEVLTGDIAYPQSLPKCKMKSQVKAGDLRPDLPHECPKQLASLLQRCWDGDFRQRPDFDGICQELRFIKGLILRGDLQTSPQTEDGIKHGLDVEGARAPQATLKSWVVSFFKAPRRIWASKIPYFFMVLFSVIMMLLLSITVASRYQVSSSTGGNQFSIVTRAIKEGPWGRNETKKTTGLFDKKADSIKKIYLKYNQTPPGIGCMAVKYANHDGTEEVTRRYGLGGVGGKDKHIPFEAGEYIKQVSGFVDRHYVTVGKEKVGLVSVVSLTIHSNFRSYGPFGDERGRGFKEWYWKGGRLFWSGRCAS